jgi:hypothetical protein
MPLNSHMNKDVFAWCLKKHLLKVKQILAHVGDPPKKLLSSQKVGLKNRQPKVTWPMYFIMPSGMGKCQFQHVLLHPKK